MSQEYRPETNLVQTNLDDVRAAPGAFGWKVNNGCTPLVYTPVSHGHRIHRIVVPHGFDAIMEKNGRIIGVIKPGVYYRPHWYKIAFVVSKQHIPYHFAVRSCPTLDNVRVDIHVDFLFHVADSVRFVYGIAPENMEELLRATQAETVRSLVRTVRIGQVRNLRGVNSEDMIITLNEKLNPYGIHIDQVTIANVELPSDVALSLQRTTAFSAKQSLLQKQHMYSMKTRDDEQTLETAQMQRANERERTAQEAKRAREATLQQIATIRNERNKVVAAKRAERDSQISAIRAESQQECTKINMERERLVHEILEKGRAEQQKRRLESERECKAIHNETEAKLAEIRAKIFAVRAEAEKYSSKKLEAKRQHQERIARLEAIIALAHNPNVVISGDTGDNPLAALLAANRSAVMLGVGKKY